MKSNRPSPATPDGLHHCYNKGDFVIAFNGVASASSPTIMRALYGEYYRQWCLAHEIDNCWETDEFLPWRMKEGEYDSARWYFVEAVEKQMLEEQENKSSS